VSSFPSKNNTIRYPDQPHSDSRVTWWCHVTIIPVMRCAHASRVVETRSWAGLRRCQQTRSLLIFLLSFPPALPPLPHPPLSMSACSCVVSHIENNIVSHLTRQQM